MGEPAQASERVPNLRLRASQPLRGRRIGSGEGDPQMERDADQPLLGAVVQVALDAPAFGIRGRDHPPLGGSDLGQPGAGDGGQLGVAQRQPVAGVRPARTSPWSARLASRRRSTGPEASDRTR